MSSGYAYTPVIWPSVATILLLLILAAFSWHRRSVPGALPFAIYCLFGVPMLFFKLIGYLAVDFETKIFWFKFEASFWIPIATALTCFTLEYTYPGRWLTHRNLALLSIIPDRVAAPSRLQSLFAGDLWIERLEHRPHLPVQPGLLHRRSQRSVPANYAE